MSTNTRFQVKYVALGSLLCTWAFALLVITLHVLRPQLNPLRHTISEYEIGPYGYFMIIAFIARSLAIVLLVVGLALDTIHGNRSWAGLILLFISALCSLLVAIFPPYPQSLLIHTASALIDWICLFSAAFVWSWRFRKDTRWRFSSATSLVLGVLILLAFIGALANPVGLKGLTERILEVFIVLWLYFMAWRLGFTTTEGRY